MDEARAGLIVARLQAQWPGIASDDIGARDWLRVVCRTSRQVGELAVEDLIDGWARDRYPRPGDWQEACRSVAARLGTSGPELDDGLWVAPGDVRELAAGDATAGPVEPIPKVLARLRDRLSEGSAKLKVPGR